MRVHGHVLACYVVLGGLDGDFLNGGSGWFANEGTLAVNNSIYSLRRTA